MTKNAILFITNGTSNIGFGHISRDLVIANEFKNNEWDILVLVPDVCIFKPILRETFNEVYCFSSFRKQNIEGQLFEIKKNYNLKVVFIDLIESEYEQLSWLKDTSLNLLIVTLTLFLFPLNKRYEDISFFPDMEPINNSNKNLKLYSGPNYFVFRREFQNIKNTINKTANNILITMGGTDPYGLTILALNALIKTNYHITVILSSHSPSYEIVLGIAKGNKRINLIEYTDNIALEMTKNDLVILNGGLTRYEVCVASTPFIAISIHQIQFDITKKLTDIGVGVNLGIKQYVSEQCILKSVEDLMNNYLRRLKMSQKMNSIFDLKGPQRIYDIIIKKISE